jgi:hypothetical protein
VKRIALSLGLLMALCAAAVAGAASPPTLKLDAPSVSGSAFYKDSTLWFRPDGSGSFTLKATATGVASVAFPDLSSTTGWPTSTGGTDTSSPYASPVAYTWVPGAAAPGAQKVTAEVGTAEALSAAVSINADAAPPTGQTIALVGGPYFATTSVPLTISRGSDAASGVDPTGDVVERASAPLQNGLCGTFGSFAAVTLVSGTDTSLATGNCYRWQVKVKDNVGNVSPPAASTDAKVDTTPPTAPNLHFAGLVNAGATGNVVYYRPSAAASFTISAAASDPESAVTSYSFPSIPGATQVGTNTSMTFVVGSLPAPPSSTLAVTAKNGAGLSSSATTFSLVPDTTPPSLTARCNGAPCTGKPYRGAVRVTFEAADSPGSGLDRIRYTTNGSVPTKGVGFDYTSGIVVRSLAQLKVRAIDRAGNASAPLSLTVRSLADRLTFVAPATLTVAAADGYLKAGLSLSKRAKVVAVMTGPGLASPPRWSFLLERGAWVVQLRIPKTVERGHRYTVRWTVTSGTGRLTRVTHVTLR